MTFQPKALAAPKDATLPHNLEAEQALIGAVLSDNRILRAIEDVDVRPTAFYDPCHGLIWQLIGDMTRGGHVADAITLHSRLVEREQLKDIGGPSYLAVLVNAGADASVARDYAGLINDLALRRDMIREAEAIAAEARRIDSSSDGAAKILDAASGKLGALERGSDHRSVSAHEAMIMAVEEAEKVIRDKAPPVGISTGLRYLDANCGLLRPGELVVLAGRPGMGKSALAVEIAYNMSRAGHGVGYFSPEMEAAEHGHRMASSIAYTNHARIPYENISAGKMTTEQLKMLAKCALETRNIPFLVDDRGELPFDRLVMRIRALDRQMVQRFGKRLEVVIIDHLGLMRAPKIGFGGNRVQEVSEMTAGLKRTARDMNLVVILLSQLNRAVESREDKRPLMNDLRESGSIEQDANKVLLVYREAYYLNKQLQALLAGGRQKTEEFDDLQDRLSKVKDKIEVNVAKRRGGKEGLSKLNCYIQYNAIRDPIDDDQAHESSLIIGDN